jgi:hypothetical protein
VNLLGDDDQEQQGEENPREENPENPVLTEEQQQRGLTLETTPASTPLPAEDMPIAQPASTSSSAKV